MRFVLLVKATPKLKTVGSRSGRRDSVDGRRELEAELLWMRRCEREGMDYYHTEYGS